MRVAACVFTSSRSTKDQAKVLLYFINARFEIASINKVCMESRVPLSADNIYNVTIK